MTTGWLVIINPNAGKGKGKKDSSRILSLLKKAGFTFTPKFTERRGHAIVHTKQGIEEGFRMIIIVGGDGTLNEVVNGIMTNGACPSEDITIGLIPVGTGNDWGRMFGIPMNYDSAISIITKNKTMLHDIGHVRYFEETREKERYFINMAGLGFQSAVVKRSNHQKEKGRGGKLIYLYSLLKTLITYRNVKSFIKIDNEEIEADIFSVSIGNGRYSGSGMRQNPEAIPDDGLFDISVINNMGKVEVVRSIGLLYDGTILSHPKIDGYRGKTIEISSETPVNVDADGETLGHTPACFNIIPRGINIIYHTRVTC
ncbi:MAG TPA: diacylglycerol kinase family protein [Bacteroidales bacterium]|nr:diacylglycerol kinase family protein [Bacteroidales bacterium]